MMSALRKARATLAAVAVAGALASCGVIPKDGPTGFEVQNSAEVRLEDPGRLSYALVKLSSLTATQIQTEPQPIARFNTLSRAGKAVIRVTAADTITVSIFEAGAGGLFIPADAGSRPGNFIQVPTQEVDRNGNISIPYGGQVRALGRTPREIEAEIVSRLKSRAIEPQAIVAVGERTSNVVTVLGDVRSPSAIPLRPGGLRLLAALARAGGSTAAAHSTLVTVQRRGRSERALLTAVLQNQAQNIELEPEDTIYVSAEPRIFMAFGAVGKGSAAISIGLGGGASTPGQRFVMDRANMSLTEAIATAGGIQGGSADPRAIFLFRYVPQGILRKAGVDLSSFPDPNVPTVITLDLSQAEGYFLANQFYIKDNDIIYVSESPSVDLVKFLNIINSVNSTAQGTLGTVSTTRNVLFRQQ